MCEYLVYEYYICLRRIMRYDFVGVIVLFREDFEVLEIYFVFSQIFLYYVCGLDIILQLLLQYYVCMYVF